MDRDCVSPVEAFKKLTDTGSTRSEMAPGVKVNMLSAAIVVLAVVPVLD